MAKSKLKIYPAILIALGIVGLDQITKALIRHFIAEGTWITLAPKTFGETFRLHHLQNEGAAFSLTLFGPAGDRIFFVATSVLAVVFIGWLLYHATHKLQVVALGLVMGGAIGNNLIDRPIFGAVTDFVDVNIPNIIHGMDRFPVFNVADSAIFIAMCLIIFDLFFIKDKKTTEPAAEQTPAELIVNQGDIDEKPLA